jgi:ABC-2 type transport system permease protein
VTARADGETAGNDRGGVTAALRAEASVTRQLASRWFREMGQSAFGVAVLVGIKPLVWYVLFGSMFEAYSSLATFPADDYRAFILPGVVGLMTLEFVVLGGQCIVDDIQGGMLNKLWTAPISKTSVVLARVAMMGTVNALQVLALLGVAYLDGVRMATGLAGAAVLLALSVALTAGLTALSMFVAYELEHQFAFTAVTSFLVLPVVFLSNAFSPTSLMPDWLATVAGLNPVSVAITGMRALVLEGWVAADVWPAVATVTGFALVAMVLTVAAFDRPLEPESSTLPVPGP